MTPARKHGCEGGSQSSGLCVVESLNVNSGRTSPSIAKALSTSCLYAVAKGGKPGIYSASPFIQNQLEATAVGKKLEYKKFDVGGRKINDVKMEAKEWIVATLKAEIQLQKDKNEIKEPFQETGV